MGGNFEYLNSFRRYCVNNRNWQNKISTEYGKIQKKRRKTFSDKKIRKKDRQTDKAIEMKKKINRNSLINDSKKENNQQVIDM